MRSTFNNSDKAGEFENIIANVDEVLQTASEAVLNATKELEAEREEVSETLKTAQADENPDRGEPCQEFQDSFQRLMLLRLI